MNNFYLKWNIIALLIFMDKNANRLKKIIDILDPNNIYDQSESFVLFGCNMQVPSIRTVVYIHLNF